MICVQTQLLRFAPQCAGRRNHHVLEVLKVNNNPKGVKKTKRLTVPASKASEMKNYFL